VADSGHQAFALAERWDKARDKKSFDFSPKDIEGFSSNQTGPSISRY
jgi:hypothetical protein